MLSHNDQSIYFRPSFIGTIVTLENGRGSMICTLDKEEWSVKEDTVKVIEKMEIDQAAHS